MGPSDKPLYIIGTVLVAMMIIVGFNTFSKIADRHHADQPKTGYALPEPEEQDTADGSDASGVGDAAKPAVDMAALVAAADVASGEKLFKRCAACHSYKKGDGALLGPNLYGVVDRDIASMADFPGYSAAMKAKEGNWTLAALSDFIANPKKALPGTAMIFPGVKNDEKRAELLAYMKTLSD